MNRKEPVSARHDIQPAAQPGGMTWKEMRTVFDQIKVALHGERLDRKSLLNVEATLGFMSIELERSVHGYTAAYGGSASEAHVVRSGLKTLQHDLQWVKQRRRSVPDSEMQEKLNHASRSGANVLSLLRWLAI